MTRVPFFNRGLEMTRVPFFRSSLEMTRVPFSQLSFDPGAANGIQKTGYERMSCCP
jgi:hypothetical protein